MQTIITRPRIGRDLRQCTVDLDSTQLDDDELGEFIELQEIQAAEECRREARRKAMTACGGWAGGMVPVR